MSAGIKKWTNFLISYQLINAHVNKDKSFFFRAQKDIWEQAELYYVAGVIYH